MGKNEKKLVEDVLYLDQGMTIPLSTTTMSPITSCGRQPFLGVVLHVSISKARVHQLFASPFIRGVLDQRGLTRLYLLKTLRGSNYARPSIKYSLLLYVTKNQKR